MDKLGEILASILSSFWFLFKLIALIIISGVLYLIYPPFGILLFLVGVLVLLIGAMFS